MSSPNNSPQTSPLSALNGPQTHLLPTQVPLKKTKRVYKKNLKVETHSTGDLANYPVTKPKPLPRTKKQLEQEQDSPPPKEEKKAKRSKSADPPATDNRSVAKKRVASSPLVLWSTCVKEVAASMGIKPPIRKGTKEYEAIQELYKKRKPTTSV
jgi:hypothetical protein